jgi:hypothetical protein
MRKEDEDDDNPIVKLERKQLAELLDRAYKCGYNDTAWPTKLGSSWNQTREKLLNQYLQCTNKHKDYFTCQIQGIHKIHGYPGGNGWFYWDENGLIK